MASGVLLYYSSAERKLIALHWPLIPFQLIRTDLQFAVICSDRGKERRSLTFPRAGETHANHEIVEKHGLNCFPSLGEIYWC